MICRLFRRARGNAESSATRERQFSQSATHTLASIVLLDVVDESLEALAVPRQRHSANSKNKHALVVLSQPCIHTISTPSISLTHVCASGTVRVSHAVLENVVLKAQSARARATDYAMLYNVIHTRHPMRRCKPG